MTNDIRTTSSMTTSDVAARIDDIRRAAGAALLSENLEQLMDQWERANRLMIDVYYTHESMVAEATELKGFVEECAARLR